MEQNDLEVIPASAQTHRADDVFSDEDLQTLRDIRNLRKQLITNLTPNGKIPDDKSDKTMLIQLMAGVDSEIAMRARVKVAAKTEENNANLTALVGQAMKNFKVPRVGVGQSAEFEMPSHIKLPAPVPGQMDIGTILVTIDDLNAE